MIGRWMLNTKTSFLVLSILTLVGIGSVVAKNSGFLLEDAAVEMAQLIDNGGFEEAIPAHALGAFWLAAGERGQIEIPTSLVTMDVARTGTHSLEISRNGQVVYQYVPALEELSDRTVILGSVYVPSRGGDTASAILTIRDNRRSEMVYIFSPRPRVPENDATHAYVPMTVSANRWYDFVLDYGQDHREYFGRNPFPRLTLLLGKQDTSALPVYWDDLSMQVFFHQLSEAELLDAILNETRWVIDNLLTRTIDDVGTPTPYLIKSLDAVTGEVLNLQQSGGGGPVHNHMLAYLGVCDAPEYLAAVVAMADAIVTHLDPRTRLPRKYDGVLDEPVDGLVIPAPTIGFLLRVYELTNDVKYLTAATEIGEAILASAPRLGTTVRTPLDIPPNYIPNKFHSKTGDPVSPESTYELHIRWFASAGALIHLYSATGMTKFRDAALATALCYIDHDTVLHYWGEDYALSPFSFEPTWYDWDRIDPAFDDYFGYGIGGRRGPFAILDIYARTGDERLRPFLDESLAYMGGVWEEGIYRGGYTFADDARSWQAYYDRYVVDPEAYAKHKDLLIRNARNVFRSSQYSNGAWIDARFRLWNPSFPDDQASCPRNLLAALTWAYLVDDRNPVWRAMIASVFEKTISEYKYDYGYICKPEGVEDGPNLGGMELRFLGELLNHLVPHLENQ